MNILFTSAGRRSYLLRYFKEALGGQGLVIAGNSADCPSFRVADDHVITPLIYDENYIPFLTDYCKRLAIDLIIPLLDIDIPVLANHKTDFLDVGTFVVAPDYEIARICNDKYATAAHLRSHGFKTPKTFLGLANALAALRSGDLDFPVIVKPRWGMASIGIMNVESESALVSAFDMVEEEIARTYLKYESNEAGPENVIVQERLQGVEHGLDVMCDLEGSFCGISVKQKMAMRAGETDAALTVQLPHAAELGESLSRAVPHPGNLDVDAFLCGDDLYILELNARFGGGYPFSHVAGVNLPKAIIEWKNGRIVSPETLVPQIGVYAYKEIELRTIDGYQANINRG